MKINPGFYHSIRSVMCCQTKPKRSVAFFCLSKNLAERLTKDTSETFSCLSLWQPSHHLLRIQIGNMSENMALLCCGRTLSMCGLTRGRWRGRQRRQISRKCNEMGGTPHKFTTSAFLVHHLTGERFTGGMRSDRGREMEGKGREKGEEEGGREWDAGGGTRGRVSRR